MNKIKLKRSILISLILIILISGGVWQLSRLPVPLFPDDYSTVVVDESGEYLRIFLNSKDQWIFPPVEEGIPKKLKVSVINFEDKRFFNHIGIDFLAVARAVVQDLKAWSKVSGASTITMQVARLTRAKERTISNKLIEIIQALKIENTYSKEEILRLYLTHAPYGGNIIGYKAASLRYFGKEPDQLTWGQASLLAVLPNSPGLITPTRGRERLKQKRDGLLDKLKARGIIDDMTCRLAKAEEIPNREVPFNLAAPHLTRSLKNKLNQDLIKTTINKKMQIQVNYLVKNYMEKMKQKGVNNSAVLIADTRTGQVKTYIGSNDYFDQQHSGKIDGVQIKRSSGSILKPFLYALAMDEGLIIPESKIEDIPVSYGAYSPYNANHRFKGVVTAREALINSLNAPAVSLLDDYGVTEFYNFLTEAGVSTLFRDAKGYGLPLILGGAEVKMWDMVALYRGLGNYGRFSGLHVLAKGKNGELKQLISKGSAYLTLNIIDDLKRPGLEYFWRDYSSKWRIAWKTGTSYGNRDAWAVGVSPEWTIAVWIGNFDGQENEEISGLNAAAPLFFSVFNALPKNYYQDFFAEPEGDLKKIKVSTKTGYRIRDKIINEGLGNLTDALVSKSAQPLIYSPYEKLIYTNRAGTYEVCSLCWDRDDLAKSLKLVYPPQVVAYLKERGNEVYTTLPHKQDCPSVSNGNPIEFIYPQQDSIISIPRGADGKYQKVNFKVAHTGKNSKLFWYLDQEYLGSTTGKHQKLLLPEHGKHTLHVVDNEGHHQEISFYIKINN
ncbi:penicillin-binding protein 1C [Iocasia frigidifontis]|uniref:Penicillin-binding protein 1A n=1 Tax=Iocasia fonsfrigidae TaxID=2682810 RepID=A0A8A7KD45_9FIRM|nr:penicillin-binding protein 1C [Iocasia fonsfrigidae]QTL98025.1 penicillin-binding protein 1C [Iocasia fonsfrigidae]